MRLLLDIKPAGLWKPLVTRPKQALVLTGGGAFTLACVWGNLKLHLRASIFFWGKPGKARIYMFKSKPSCFSFGRRKQMKKNIWNTRHLTKTYNNFSTSSRLFKGCEVILYSNPSKLGVANCMSCLPRTWLKHQVNKAGLKVVRRKHKQTKGMYTLADAQACKQHMRKITILSPLHETVFKTQILPMLSFLQVSS